MSVFLESTFISFIFRHFKILSLQFDPFLRWNGVLIGKNFWF